MMVCDPIFVFSDELGKHFEVEGYDWNWGDYDEVEIDNVIDFAAFIGNREYTNEQIFNFNWLTHEADEYYRQKYEHD